MNQRARSEQRGERSIMWCVVVGAALALLAPVASGHNSGSGSDQQASTIRLRAKLDARQVQVAGGQETKVPNASGLFTATLTGNKLSWTLTYRGLSGPANGAHIHIAKPGASRWEPVIGLCGLQADAKQPATCKPGVHGTATVHAGTLYTISASKVRNAILNGGAYVNVHTPKNYTEGEIRGQIEVAN